MIVLALTLLVSSTTQVPLVMAAPGPVCQMDVMDGRPGNPRTMWPGGVYSGTTTRRDEVMGHLPTLAKEFRTIFVVVNSGCLRPEYLNPLAQAIRKTGVSFGVGVKLHHALEVSFPWAQTYQGSDTSHPLLVAGAYELFPAPYEKVLVDGLGLTSARTWEACTQLLMDGAKLGNGQVLVDAEVMFAGRKMPPAFVEPCARLLLDSMRPVLRAGYRVGPLYYPDPYQQAEWQQGLGHAIRDMIAADPELRAGITIAETMRYAASASNAEPWRWSWLLSDVQSKWGVSLADFRQESKTLGGRAILSFGSPKASLVVKEIQGG